MDDLPPPQLGVRGGLVETQSREFERRPVRVNDPALRVEGDEMLGNEVDDDAEFALILPDLLLGFLPIVDVGPRAVPADDASAVAEGGGANQEPAVIAISSP